MCSSSSLCALALHLVHSQSIRITGKVVDEQNDALPGVNVLVKGTTSGTSTDAAGTYTLDASRGGSLVFSFIGYQSQEVPVGNNSVLNVTLKGDVAILEEVVVTGYGTQSRETLTTSITKLDNKVLENVPYTNAASALQGSVSGVRVQSTSGQPGAAPELSFEGEHPLITQMELGLCTLLMG